MYTEVDLRTWFYLHFSLLIYKFIHSLFLFFLILFCCVLFCPPELSYHYPNYGHVDFRYL